MGKIRMKIPYMQGQERPGLSGGKMGHQVGAEGNFSIGEIKFFTQGIAIALHGPDTDTED